MEQSKYLQIIRNYRRFFFFVFKYFIVLIALVVSFLLFKKYFLNPSYQSQHSDPFFIQKTKLVKSFEKFLQQTIGDNALQIYILQGPLTTQNNFILSQDNLITYKGFVVPRYFSIATTLPIKSLSYFTGTSYDTGELAQVITNLVLTRKFSTQENILNIQLPLQNTIVDTFTLKCLSQNAVLPRTCDYYISNFLSSFFVYKLSDDYIGLQNIFVQLHDKPRYRAQFCDNMQKYVLYSNDKSEQLKPIFDQCGDTSKAFFKRMELFIDIQKQLEDKLMNTDTYKDQTLNEYKLLSFQQLIYNDLLDQRIQINQYTSYLDFLTELLQHESLPQFYIDEIYRFNNYYLKPVLQSARYITSLSSDKQNQINAIVKDINSLNGGGNLSLLSGLNQMVRNPALLHMSTPALSGAVLSPQDTITKQLQTISYLEITTVDIQNAQISITGYFLWEQEKIATHLQLVAEGDSFIVQTIALPAHTDLAETLQALAGKQPLTLGELFATLSRNLSLYTTDKTTPSTTINQCTSIRELESILGISVAACTSDHIIFHKNIDDKDIIFTLLLDNRTVTDITISNDTIQTSIQQLFQQNNYDNLSLGDTIKIIANSSVDTFTSGHEGTIQSLAVLNDFQKYLNITPNDIAERSGKILVDFTVNDVNFVAGYTDHLLSPRYFKNIITTGKPLIIQNLSLILDDAHQDAITLFVKDPVGYIKNIDLLAWRNYVSQGK